MVVLLQLIGGVMLAVLLWVLIKAAFKLIVWIFGLLILFVFVFPGFVFLTGTLLFTWIGLLIAFGVLLILSAIRS